MDQLMFVGPSLNEGKSITKLEGIGLGGGSDTPTTTAPTESQATAATTSTSAASQTTTTAATTRTAATTSPADKDGAAAPCLGSLRRFASSWPAPARRSTSW